MNTAEQEYACISTPTPLQVTADVAALRLLYGEQTYNVCIPPDVNEIMRCEECEHTITVHCKHPHGLFVVNAGGTLLAPRHVPLLLAPSMVALDDLGIVEQIVCVSATAFSLPLRARAQLASNAALCYQAAATTDVLVRTVADRLPHGCRLSHSLLSHGTIRLHGPPGKTLQVTGGLCSLLNLHPSGINQYVCYDVQARRALQVPVDIDLRTLCEASEATEAAVIDGGSLQIEVAGKTHTIRLPAGTYDLSTVANALNGQLGSDKPVHVSATLEGLVFESTCTFGVRMDTIEGLSCWQLGYMPAAMRACSSYAPYVSPVSVLPLSAPRPRLRLAAHAGQVYVGMEPVGPVEACKKGRWVTLRQAMPVSDGSVLTLQFADDTQTAVVARSKGLEVELCVASDTDGACQASLYSWVEHMYAHIGWIMNGRMQLTLAHAVAAKASHAAISSLDACSACGHDSAAT